VTRRADDLGLAPAFDEERVAAAWQRLARARADRRRGRSPVLAFAAAAALGMAVAAVAIGWRGPDAPATRPVPGALVSRDPAIPVAAGAVIDRGVDLDDGSRIALAAGALLHVLGNDGAQFVTLLEGGTARFEVTPGGPRRWTIETALATIEVAGTIFTVESSPDRLVVAVERGLVIVRGDRVPGRLARLSAGDRLAIEPSPLPEPEPEPEPVKPRPPPRTVSPPPPTLDDLLAEADRLRAAGRHTAAADLLEHAVDADPDHPAAGLASFTVGRLALDVLDQPDRAAAAFARVIDRGRPAALLEDAHARRAEALLEAGRRDDAAAAIDAYERAFPASPRAAALRARLDAP
jgi:transmembrane sensor